MISRRCLCGIGAAGLFASVGSGLAQAQARRPFCRFDLDEGWSSEPRSFSGRIAGADDPSGVPKVVSEVKRVLEVRASFDLYITPGENNAFATVVRGRKVIGVDVGFLQKLNRIAQTEWGAIQVIAHEVGHHIAGFDSNQHRGELNADYWSGQALQRLGSAQASAAALITRFGPESDTPSHPSKHRRAEVIRRGWADASRGHIDYSFCLTCR